MRYLFIILILFITLNNNIFSAVFTSTQAGAFNNIATWGGGGFPGAGDDVFVNHNVSIGANTSVISITINNGGILRSSAVSVNLTLTGNLNIQAGGEFRGVDGVNNLNLVFNGTSQFTNAGTASFKNITVNANRTLTLNSSIGGGLLNTSTININGTLNCQGNTLGIDALSVFNLNSGATLRTNLAGGVDATITGIGTKNYNVAANYYFDSNVTDLGMSTINTVNDMTFDGCTITSIKSLTITGILYNGVSNGIINDTNTSNTFTLTGNHVGDVLRTQIGNLKVTNNYSNYGRLTISGTLEVDPGITFGVNSARDFILNNNAQIINNGTITCGNFRALNIATINGTGVTQVQTFGTDASNLVQNSGTFTVAGTTTIQSGNNYNFNTLNVTGNLTFEQNIIVESDLVVSGTLTSSTNQIDLQNGGNSIYGGGTLVLKSLLINGATSLIGTDITTNNITLNAGTFDIQDNELRIRVDITNNGGNIDATDVSSIFRIAGSAANFTIPTNTFVANTFGVLTISKNGTISATNNYIVQTNLNLFNVGAIFDIENYTLTLNGAITTNNGVLDLTDNASTLIIAGTGATNFPSTSSNQVGNLNLTRNGTVTLNNNLTVNSTLNLNNAGLVFDIQTNTLTLDNPIVSTNGSLDLTDNNSTLNLAFDGVTTFSSGAFLNGEVGNLSITGASTITLGSNADIDNSFTMNNPNALFDIDAYRLRLGGNLNFTDGIIDGTDPSSTLSFAGTAPITFNSGAFSNNGTIGNLELLQSNTITQVGLVNVINNLYVNNASLYYDAQANELNISGDLIYTAGVLDFTDFNSLFKISAGNPFTINGNHFVNNQIGNFAIQRNDLVTLVNDLEVLNTLYLQNPNMHLDLQTNNARLTLYNNIDNQSPASTKIRCQTGGTIITAGSNNFSIDGNDFLNNDLYNLTLNNSNTVTLVSDIGIPNNLTMTAASPTFDLDEYSISITGNFLHTAGFINATNGDSGIGIYGAGAFILPNCFVNNEISALSVFRNGTVTQNGPIIVDFDFTISHPGAIYNLNSNTITLAGFCFIVDGKINAEANGSAVVLANGVTTTSYSGNSFVNNTINRLFINDEIILNNNFVIGNLLNVDNGIANFQGNNVEIQGNVTLDNTGSLNTAANTSVTFSNNNTINNNSTGSIGLNDTFVTGNLTTSASANIAGNFNVSGVANFTSGTMNFVNSTSKTITNTGTLDFNFVNIGSGSDVRTASSFDINNDFRMVDNTSVFVASSPSEIRFTQNNMQIFAETNSDGSSTGLTFFSVNFGNSITVNFRGTYDFYINGNYNSNNSNIVFEDNSHLFFTSSAPSTPTFGYLTVYDLTFTPTANFANYNIQTRLNNSLNVDVGGNLRTVAQLTVNNNSVVLTNNAPNTYSNLDLRYLTLTSGTCTTDDSFTLRQTINIDASSVLNQTSGTFAKGNGIINNNGDMTINEFYVFGDATTSTGFQVDGNYYLQDPARSFIASAGSITFTNPNLEIINAGNTQFHTMFFDDAVTNGTTYDDFTIAGDLELGASALFTATSPSEITFSGNGTINSPTSSVGGVVGLFFHDVDFTGNYATNSAVANQVIFEVSGSMNVDGSFDSNTNTEILFTGAGNETITNNGSLDFNTITINNGNYSTSTDFNVKNLFTVNTGNTFEATNGTIYLTGTSSSISNNSTNDIADFKFNNLEVNGSNAYGSNSFTISGNLTVNNNSNFNHSSGEIRFVGGGTHNILNNGNLTFHDFSIADNNAVQTATNFNVKGSRFDLYGGNSTFLANAGNVSFITNSPSSTITSGGGLGSIIFNDFTIGLDKSVYVEEDLDIIINGNLTSNGFGSLFTSGNSTFYFQGSNQQSISVENNSNVNFQNLTLNNSNGLNLNNNINVNELNIFKNLTLESGDLDLNGDNIFTFQKPFAHLFENGGIVKNTIDNIGQLGHIYYEYNFNTLLNNLNFAGLGIGFRQASGAGIMGLTTIKRYHTSNEIAGGISIQRLFSVESANNNLRARPIIDYYDSEIRDLERPKEELILSSTRTIGELWAAIETKNISVTNRLECLDTINEFAGFNTLWTAVVPIRLTLREVEDRADLTQIPNRRFVAGTTDHNILGFNISSTNDTEITDLKIYVENNKRQFINFKLYTSIDEFYSTKNDNELIGSIDFAQDSLDFNVGEITLSSTRSVNFFLIADISDSVTIFADSVLVYINQSGIRLNLNQGIVNLKVVGDIYYNFQQRIDVEFNPIGLNTNPLMPNTFNNAIYGFELKPLGNQASLNEFELYFKNTPLNSISGHFRLFKSTDNNFLTSNDNIEIPLLENLSVINKNSYVFKFNEDSIPKTGRYYFVVVDSISNLANDGTIDMHIGIPQQSLKSQRAAPIAIDTVYGNKFHFESLKTKIISSNNIPEGNIYKNGRKQNLYGFTIENNNIAELKKLIVEFNASGGLNPSQHFTNIRLWIDDNENNAANNSEIIATGKLSTNLIAFENFSKKVEFKGQKRFIITADISGNAPENGIIRFNIPNESYVLFSPHAKVESGGPFFGNNRQIKTPKPPVEMRITEIFPSFIKSKDRLDVTIKLFDEDATETIANQQYNVNLTFLGNVTASGNSNGSFVENESFLTISGYTLTNDAGSTPVRIRANNSVLGNVNSNTFTVFPLAPTTNSTSLVLSAGSQPKTSILVNSWVNGGGTNRIIVVKPGEKPVPPTDGLNYISETNIIASQIDLNQTAQGSFVVYNGSGVSMPFSLTGLLPGIKYYFQVFEFFMFDGKPIYLNNIQNPVYVYQTSDDEEGVLNNTSDDPITIFENIVVKGRIINDIQEDWYKFKTEGNNILVNSCGEFLYIDLYKFNPATNKLKLIRRTQNTGANCQVIILNDDNGEEYFLKVFRLNNVETADYELKFRTYNFELFSRKECDCP